LQRALESKLKKQFAIGKSAKRINEYWYSTYRSTRRKCNLGIQKLRLTKNDKLNNCILTIYKSIEW